MANQSGLLTRITSKEFVETMYPLTCPYMSDQERATNEEQAVRYLSVVEQMFVAKDCFVVKWEDIQLGHSMQSRDKNPD